MKDLNSFNCTCFCAADPQVKDSTNGNKFCSSRVGINRLNDEVDWYTVKLWGKPAEIFGEHVKKGAQLALSGAIHLEQSNDKMYPTIYVTDFRFIGGGNKKGKTNNDSDVQNATVQSTDNKSDLQDEDIPF